MDVLSFRLTYKLLIVRTAEDRVRVIFYRQKQQQRGINKEGSITLEDQKKNFHKETWIVLLCFISFLWGGTRSGSIDVLGGLKSLKAGHILQILTCLSPMVMIRPLNLQKGDLDEL